MGQVRCEFVPCGWPGHPEKTVKGGTTVSGGRTVLSKILQQSFSTQRRPCTPYIKQREKKNIESNAFTVLILLITEWSTMDDCCSKWHSSMHYPRKEKGKLGWAVCSCYTQFLWTWQPCVSPQGRGDTAAVYVLSPWGKALATFPFQGFIWPSYVDGWNSCL